MKDGTITMNDGRTVGFADYGTADQPAAIWCHGAPGNRFEPGIVAEAAGRAGIRLVGIDRPGYGLSTPQPGRTIGGWISDALAVADHLGIRRFLALGVSTGGAYALALAARSPRVLGAVVCCALSDMRWKEGKAMNVACHPVWNASDRAEALAIADDLFGAGGTKLLPPLGPPAADSSDAALFAIPSFLSLWAVIVRETFTQGSVGYVDDRLADKDGWRTFDVADVACPVVVMHGTSDGLIPVENARYTAAIVPGAALRIFEGLGHVSVVTRIVDVGRELLTRCATVPPSGARILGRERA